MAFLEPLIGELRSRSSRAIDSLLALNNPALRAYVRQLLAAEPGAPGALLADPLIEPTFGWRKCESTFGELKGGLLDPVLVRNMASPPPKTKVTPFKETFKPFTHQLEAWQVLSSEPARSVVVTSGTGSGKTECFMVPVLNSLASQIADQGTLEGVQALMIYPLNALINSQKNRLNAWTDGFGGKIRYCLYTGALPNEEKSTAKEYKGQVIDRRSLRESAPPILITNATMLEYMLVRKDDAPILQQSKGKLRWIVLDEAHTLVGSQAAEMAMLLRRVMQAFEVAPRDVRFVATSATFDSGVDTVEKLTAFLSDISGVPPSQISVIHGHRQVPQILTPMVEEDQEKSLEEVAALQSAEEASGTRYEALSRHPVSRGLRDAFLSGGKACVRSISQLEKILDPAVSYTELLRWLDLMSGTKLPDGVDEPFFLPLRLHLFHNLMNGLSACVDPGCHCKHGTALDDPRWMFGMVYTDERTSCLCGAPVVSVVRCGDCSELFLLGTHSGPLGLSSIAASDEDDFTLDIEDDSTEEDNSEVPTHGEGNRWLIVNRDTPVDSGVESKWYDRENHRVVDQQPEGNSGGLRALIMIGPDECPCCKAESLHRRLFMPTRISASFILSTVIPTLLEFCPEDESPLEKPFRGRKMISFTDSRQGTARIAAKLQQDSERLRVRGLVYHQLLNESGSTSLTVENEEDIAYYQSQKADGTLSPPGRRALEDLLGRREKAKLGTVLSWDQMVGYLGQNSDISRAMLRYYNALPKGPTAQSLGPNELAGIFLAREFMRRPKYRNSLETMGLVQVVYPQLDSIVEVPTGWPQTVESWQSFLKVLLDFHIRENSYVQINEDWRRFIGTRFSPKWLLRPDSEEETTGRHKRWPQIIPGRDVQARPIHLLCLGLGWSHHTRQDDIDFFLQSAWHVLTSKLALLTGTSDGVQLDLRKLHFRIPQSVLLCPITGRFLDTTFGPISPYSTATREGPAASPVQYEIPKFPNANVGALDETERLDKARQWLNSCEQVLSLREQGHWSDLHDRVIEGGTYFCTAEHSAQQKHSVLTGYEEKFTAGEINLLSCSTTMEMGIDISGISAVANSNVPPQPANYLQRAGRAGRRGEGRSIALTVCRRTPHDQHVFHKPAWPFETPIVVPKVSLRSLELVKRHLNAFLLSFWMKSVLGQDEIRKTTAGAFFAVDPEASDSAALWERFQEWCVYEAPNDARLVAMLKSLVETTTLAQTHPGVLMRATAKSIKEIAGEWLAEYHYARQEEEYFKGTTEAKSAALRALNAQLSRLRDAYLLSELAAGKFLPGYGFPTDIVTFNNTYYQPNRGSPVKKSREDKWGGDRDLPTRDRATALREYAPGNEVVIDGLVYQSRGISLNWKLPATVEEVREAQLFKWAWQCRDCGRTGSSYMQRPEACPLGHQLDEDDVLRYLVPSGFAIEFAGALPHTNVEQPIFIPVEKPRLSVNEPLLPLANPLNGLFRASSRAHLFHHTAGTYGGGFAICLECGRAEPMIASTNGNAADHLPASFSGSGGHRRLRGGKDDNGDTTCPGSENRWKIQTNVRLGHDTETDALEVLLRNSETGAYLADKDIAFTIAVALRNAVANALGVVPDELGYGCRPVEWEGRQVQLVQVYDLRSGGYTTQVALEINQRAIWGEVYRTLDCPHCQGACQNCLMSFDTRFDAHRLNRLNALNWIDQRWLDSLALPATEMVFGTDSSAETLGLLESAQVRLNNGLYTRVDVYLQGHPNDWELPIASRLLERLANWTAAPGLQVRLIAPNETLNALHESNRYRLAALVDNGCQYIEVDASNMKIGNSHHLLIALESETLRTTWASTSDIPAIPDANWGENAEGRVVVRGNLDWSVKDVLAVPASMIRPQAGDVEVDIQHQLNETLTGFGKRFWGLLCKSSPVLDSALSAVDSLVKVEYVDRYLRNPFTVALLLEVVGELRALVYEADSGMEVCIKGQSYEAISQSPSQLWHDWKNSHVRDAALLAGLEYCGFEAKVVTELSIDHSRMLQLTFISGHKIRVRLDQGLSHWIPDRHHGPSYRRQFAFTADNKKQGQLLSEITGRVLTKEGAATHVFIRAISD